jgi:hypothetical protein
MTQGFYEQLGVEAGASAGQVRSAYTQGVGRLAKRRKALVDQGGDASAIDLARSQLDEAMAVLSDPLRRRRYDAMLRWVASAPENGQTTADALWEGVADALVHPAAVAATRLLRATTQLGLAEISAPASAGDEPPTLVPADEDLTSPRIPRRLGSGDPAQKSPSSAAPKPSRVARPAAPTPPVIAMPEPEPAPKAKPEPKRRVERQVSAEDIARLVDQHGHTGALLKAVREARGLSVPEVSETTRISVRYLEAIEADSFDALPSSTFVRGYVREMARLLKLDDVAVVAGYMRRLQE